MAESPERTLLRAISSTTSSNLEEINKKALEFIDHVTAKADEVQCRVLSDILSQNAHVEYLRRHGLGGAIDRETFKRVMPVITYEDIKSDINRIADGDTTPIFCSEPISEFMTSSGTSGGERKLIPMLPGEQERRFLVYSLLMPVTSQFIPGLEKGKGLYFLFTKPESKTPGGLVARPVLTSYYNSQYFLGMPNDVYNNHTSPRETILCTDPDQSMYSQLLCGLCQRDQVVRVGSVFASTFVRAIKFLEQHWPLLCNDIKTGTLNLLVNDPSVREAVFGILKPDLKLADFVEAVCSKESWKGIIRKLWPNAKYVDVIVTGSLSQYIPTIEYYVDDLPLASTICASSETYFGVNLNPLCKPTEVSYTFIPTLAYFEFLPLRSDNGLINNEDLVDLVDVKLGQEYEVVVTTYAGLYRYRMGDVVRVAGFKNKAPQFNFVGRQKVILSIESDKTDEIELQNAIKNATSHLEPFGATLSEYTSYADTSTIPGHYVLFWEISNGSTPIPPSVFEECCITIEESLSSVYRQGRASDKSIGPLEIKIVEAGTFDELMDYAIKNLGSSMAQYKAPKSVKLAPIVELLISRVVKSFTSPKCPKWTPGHKQWRDKS